MNLALKLPLAESGFAELAAALFWKPEEAVAMLWAYFDESGEHDKASGALRELTIGGLIAPQEAWQAFDVEWSAALARRDLREFHRRQFNPKGIGQFLEIIARHVRLAISFTVTADSSTSDAYERGLIDCLLQVANVSRIEEISLVFAIHPEFPANHMKGYFDLVNWDRGGAQLSHLGLSDPKKVQPLQAADLVAHALRSDGATVRQLEELGCKVFRFRNGRPA